MPLNLGLFSVDPAGRRPARLLAPSLGEGSGLVGVRIAQKRDPLIGKERLVAIMVCEYFLSLFKANGLSIRETDVVREARG
jgi:hypothetical protein